MSRVKKKLVEQTTTSFLGGFKTNQYISSTERIRSFQLETQRQSRSRYEEIT